MCDYFQFPNVTIRHGAQIGHYVILGVPPRGCEPGELDTLIGSNTIIRSHTVIYAGNHIGCNFETGHNAMVRELNEIGDDVRLGSHSIVEHHVKIGNNVHIHSNAFIPEFSILENNTWIGPNVVFTNALYPRSPYTKQHLKGPHLKQGARIGANATLLPGVIIGRNALVGAGAVVVKNVPDHKVVVGHPARVIKDISEIPAYNAE